VLEYVSDSEERLDIAPRPVLNPAWVVAVVDEYGPSVLPD